MLCVAVVLVSLLFLDVYILLIYIIRHSRHNSEMPISTIITYKSTLSLSVLLHITSNMKSLFSHLLSQQMCIPHFPSFTTIPTWTSSCAKTIQLSQTYIHP